MKCQIKGCLSEGSSYVNCKRLCSYHFGIVKERKKLKGKKFINKICLICKNLYDANIGHQKYCPKCKHLSYKFQEEQKENKK